MKTKDRFVKHMPCKHCGSSDAVGMYSNGIGTCFHCKKTTFENEREYTMQESHARPHIIYPLSYPIGYHLVMILLDYGGLCSF